MQPIDDRISFLETSKSSFSSESHNIHPDEGDSVLYELMSQISLGRNK